MLPQGKQQDFVIATGETVILEEFVTRAFGAQGLNWQEHVVKDHSLVGRLIY